MDQRNHQRKQPGPQFLKVGLWVPDAEGGKEVFFTAQGVDICSEGVGIVLPHCINEGTVVKVQYPINGDDLTVPIFSKVVWCRAENSHSHIGLQFLA